MSPVRTEPPLSAFLDAAEAVEAKRAELAADLRAVYREAKAHGYDPKALRKIVMLRRKGDGQGSLVDLYLRAVEAKRDAERRLADVLQATSQRSFAELADGQERARWQAGGPLEPGALSRGPAHA